MTTLAVYPHRPGVNEWKPPSRLYWSLRHGTAPDGGLLPASVMFDSLVSELTREGYLAEWFGQSCVDGDITGRAGQNLGAFVYRKTRHANIWPVADHARGWDEDTLYTAVEFFYDHVSRGIDGRYHSYLGCGQHYDTYDPEAGRAVYRAEVNELLDHAGLDFELGDDGIVLRKAPLGLEALYEAEFVPVVGTDYEAVARHAITVFRARGSSIQDRRDAVKALADALETLRPEVEAALHSKDEGELYTLVNAFGIRHNRADQKTDYDPAIFLSWMFNYLLAALHASTGLINRKRALTLEARP